MPDLQTLGWNEFFAGAYAPYENEGFTVGRVTEEHRGAYKVFTETEELAAEITGKIRHEATSRADFPAVGDWVVLEKLPNEKRASIQVVLPRRSKFSRKAAGKNADEQIV